jgi:predicted dehydrogenase
MAGTDLGQIKTHPNVDLVAVAEIDPNRRRQAQARLRDAKIYSDWREMLEKEGKELNSVNVSTPDHMHATMAMSAMQLGIHVYGQKPLAHDVFEVRRLTEYAKENKLVTQMGIQIHSAKEYRTAVKLVHDGVIGKIIEAHSFSGKRWGDENPKPNKKDPVPVGLDWDAWIGPAPYTDYISKYYHPGQWRKRLDYGTGTFGDMGCHIYDPTFKALGLTYPISLRSEGPKPNKDNWGFDAVIHYTFPGNQYSKNKTLPVTWYDGTAQPPARIINLLEGQKRPSQGSIVVGTKGVMLIPHVGMPKLFPENKFKDHKMEIVEKMHHWHSFIDAVREVGPRPSANFDYSGPLTETVLLGGIASRFPKQELIWDAPSLSFKNNTAATELVKKTYRKGWKIKGLI